MQNDELAIQTQDTFTDLEDLDMQFFRFDELNPASYNPRKKLKPGDKEYEKLKTSIQTFGYVDPIIVNVANNNTVISGHQRMQVMMDLGRVGAKCVVVSYDLEHEKALNITMNNVNGEWDVKKLADVLDSLKEADFDLGKASIDEEQYNDVMSQAYDKKIKEDDFDVESELKQPAFSRPGDIWHFFITIFTTLKSTI